MNIHASVQCDMVSHYFSWLQQRIHKGYYYERIDVTTIKKIDLTNKNIDNIYFWTKHPSKIIKKIPLITEKFKNYEIIVCFAMYDSFYEPNIKTQKHDMIDKFRNFSDIIGKKHISFSYGPIFYNNNFNEFFHLGQFRFLCYCLQGYTKTVYLDFAINSYCQESKLYNSHMLTEKEKLIFIRKASIMAQPFDISVKLKPTYDDIIQNKDIDMGMPNTCSSKCIFCPYISNPTESKDLSKNENNHHSKSELFIGKKNDDDTII